jgi:hypothetical protein
MKNLTHETECTTRGPSLSATSGLCRNIRGVSVPLPLNFLQWVAGDLTGNRMRGLYAEWMIADRLGLTAEGSTRIEWDMVDIRYRGLNLEVKTSGNRQQWSSEETPARFSIAPQTRIWNAELNTTQRLSVPKRTANVYIFCMHRCEVLSNSTVLDEENWSFMAVSTPDLDATLGSQRTILESALGRFSQWASLDTVCEAIERRSRS